MAKILVTGADGQLGSELRRLAGTDCDEWIFTDVGSVDITDAGHIAAFFERESPDIVVNCAAWTDVDAAEAVPGGAYGINADGPRNLAAASQASGAALIHISTDFVFSGSESRPYTEQHEPHPLSVYGQTKLAGELAVLDSGCRGAIIRTSWLYSPYGRNFVKAIMAAASENPRIRVVSDQRGSPTAADGLAGAIIAMIPQLSVSEDPAEVWHYCDRGVVSRSGFAEEIVRLSGAISEVAPVASNEYVMAAPRPLYSALDTSKIERVFGIRPRRWEQALEECIDRILNAGGDR